MIKFQTYEKSVFLKFNLTWLLYPLPVYLMSVVCEEIKWLNIHHKIFYKKQHKMVSSPFYRVNVIDDYNRFMGNVDIADQMRGLYRFYHWMRKRRWWWSVLFW